MKKQAALIMAHNQFSILKKLMLMLDHEQMDIYIHVDKKSKNFHQSDFEQICQHSMVVFVPRISVHWGHSSQVDCELLLLKAALDSGEDYSYLHLLSGVDLQIKHTDEILDFFENHPNQQFIALRNTFSGVRGLSRYYFFGAVRSYNKYIAKALNLTSMYIQKLLKTNRLKNFEFALCKSQQWFSITEECAEYVLSQEEFIHNLVRFTSCSDEMFLGTVIVNSKFRNQIYEPFRSPGGHMRLIDRDRNEGASPHTWTMDDWDTIRSCPYFWARKFDEKRDPNIIEKVFETWR